MPAGLGYLSPDGKPRFGASLLCATRLVKDGVIARAGGAGSCRFDWPITNIVRMPAPKAGALIAAAREGGGGWWPSRGMGNEAHQGAIAAGLLDGSYRLFRAACGRAGGSANLDEQPPAEQGRQPLPEPSITRAVDSACRAGIFRQTCPLSHCICRSGRAHTECEW